MRRRSWNVMLFTLVALLFIFGAIIFWMYTRGIGEVVEGKPDDPLEADLSALISRYTRQEISVIDISDVTKFSWDRLFVFGPYTQPDEIESVVGSSWRGNCFTMIASLENSVLLVFSNNKKVVHCLDYPMGENDFAHLYKYTLGFSIDEARFVLDEQSDLIWVGEK